MDIFGFVSEQQLTALVYPIIFFFILGVLVPMWLANAADKARKED